MRPAGVVQTGGTSLPATAISGATTTTAPSPAAAAPSSSIASRFARVSPRAATSCRAATRTEPFTGSVEHDDAAGALPGSHGVEGLVDLVEPDPVGDQVVERQLPVQVQPGHP